MKLYCPDPALPFQILQPIHPKAPLLVASAHSGRCYTKEFLSLVQHLEPVLRQSEDFFVDQLLADAPDLGAILLTANFPRIFVDVNRDSAELDLDMVQDPKPVLDFRPRLSPRVLAGMGVIPRLLSGEKEIYAMKLPFDEIKRRLDCYYHPYHKALKNLIDETKKQFGCCLLLDCHSMPSVLSDATPHRRSIEVDYVLGDCFGSSCSEKIMLAAEAALHGLGATTKRNNPYSGGYVTQRYGEPHLGVHVLQIEINRALYMDEENLVPTDGVSKVRQAMAHLMETLSNLAQSLSLNK